VTTRALTAQQTRLRERACGTGGRPARPKRIIRTLISGQEAGRTVRVTAPTDPVRGPAQLPEYGHTDTERTVARDLVPERTTQAGGLQLTREDADL
jgi:hypothetical protein